MSRSHSLATEAVRKRAGDRCEYCRMHQSLQGATFHVEHVKPSSRGGESTLGNLAWCCPACNLHKSDRAEAVDPDREEDVTLFNPRSDAWEFHFAWSGDRVIGLTPTGRATVALFKLNSERRVLIRRAEARFGLFPP